MSFLLISQILGCCRGGEAISQVGSVVVSVHPLVPPSVHHSWNDTMIVRSLIFGIVFLCCSASMKSVFADLIFSVEQMSPVENIWTDSPNAATFGVYLRTTAADQSFVGADFTLTLSTLDGSGGLFIEGANRFSLNAGGSSGFFEAFDAPGESAVTYFLDVGTPATSLGPADSNWLLAEITLSTLGANPGTYSMSLSGLTALDSGFNAIPNSAAGSLNYSLTVVPEPSALMALLASAATALLYRRQRQ